MFKLTKIIGARTNVPEPTYINIDGKTPYNANCYYFFAEGQIATYPVNDDDLKFIPLETVPANSGKTKLLGYFVTSSMIFETEIYGDHNAVKVGDTLMPHFDETKHLCGVDAEDGVDAKLISKNEVETSNKVLVVLAW